jgi:uncharacterized protein (TIGR02452 family)
MTWIDLKADTITAALKYQNSISLVFASHKRPGGGWMNHELGQEEWIARRSDLVDRLEPYKHLYGDNTNPFYIILKNLNIKDTKEQRDFIVAPAPLAPKKGMPAIYNDLYSEMEIRIKKVCELVKDYPIFITGAWGCGFFGNNLQDVTELFKKHAQNETVIFAVK